MNIKQILKKINIYLIYQILLNYKIFARKRIFMKDFKESRFSFYLMFISIYLVYNVIIRSSLLVLVYDKIDFTMFTIFKIYSYGFLYDLASSFYLSIPVFLYLTFAPKILYASRIHKYLASSFLILVLFAFGFLSISEHIFWDEFAVRFNFIAVDYLVYTKEVIANIKQSYPIKTIIILNLFVAVLIYFPLKKYLHKTISYETAVKVRLKYFLLSLSLPIISFFTITSSNINFENKYEKNLAYNGLYQLFSSFRSNVLDYKEFYLSYDKEVVLNNYKTLVKENNSTFLFPNNEKILREIKNTGKELNKNVVMIVVESLSAEYLGAFGDKRGLTPNLSALAKESMFFTNFYATGTRTVRGMEALTLSVPPTPGRSIVKRIDNENMFSIGNVFLSKNYDTSFIYGGHGYFDNMNAFFSSNGFNEIIDRRDMNEDEITFVNAWGVADEDLYNKALKHFDKKAKNNKKFFSFIMSTSNHRPYSYPDGKIDIPSKSGRSGAVKYSDYAIGEFIKKAKNKEWFNDTIFIIVADHNASSAGKAALPVHKYKIPLLIYSPTNVKAQVISKVSSQIDLMPTIFAMFNWDYKSKLFGKNILDKNFKERALIGNYQNLGLLRDNKLTVLSSNKTVKEYEIIKQDLYSSSVKQIKTNKKDVFDAVTYYQSASYFYENKINRINN